MFLLLNVIIVNAQIKPTKQETIDWLTEKIKGLKGTAGTYTINNNIITDSYVFKSGKTFKHSFSFDDVCNARSERIENEKATFVHVKLKSPSPEYENGAPNGLTIEEGSFYIKDSGYESDTGLAERMLKAFKTLAEYNCPPKKEAF